jgi:choice-of-anchor B domain-containing protein
MLKIKITLVLSFIYFISYCQNLNITFRSQLQYPGETCANIFGYVDSLGNEYALVGVSDGMSIVNVTDPDNPFQVIQLPWPAGPNQLWKEIKTYKNYAYVVSEAGSGVQIADLRHLPSTNVPFHYWTPVIGAETLNSIHALHVDTTKGILYLYGSNVGNKGAIAADLSNPWNPVYLGKYDGAYVHDGYADNDTLFAAEIYNGVCNIIDFTNKTNPTIIGSIPTPGNFTHNSWLSPDKKTVFTTDEVGNSFLVAYDISNLSNINELDRIQSNPGTNSIVHNTHIKSNNYAVTSWYKDGITIVDVSNPNNMVQVGNYDTFTAGAGNGFDGAWGVYPFLPSGNIVVSNIDEGLFVLSPTYVRGCYLEGNVKDSITLQNLNGVSVQIFPVTQTNTLSANGGNYLTGYSTAGIYSVKFTKTGYQSRTINNVSLLNGQTTFLDVKLLPNSNGLNHSLQADENGFFVSQTIFKEKTFLKFEKISRSENDEIKIFDINGKLIESIKTKNCEEIIEIGYDWRPGIYFIYFGSKNSIKLIKSEN